MTKKRDTELAAARGQATKLKNERDRLRGQLERALAAAEKSQGQIDQLRHAQERQESLHRSHERAQADLAPKRSSDRLRDYPVAAALTVANVVAAVLIVLGILS